jgi:hypothetical protein
MKSILVRKWLVVRVLVATLVGSRAMAQETQTGITPPTKQDGLASANFSPGINDILKMVQAGISKEVLKSYIDNAPIAYHLTAADIIALKEHSVPDDLTMALVKRGAELRAHANPTPNRNSRSPAYSSSQHFDPEGYDYFSYYYLYPRTLASANQRLYSSSALFSDFSPYFYGYYQPLPFRPLPPGAFR